MRIVRNKMGDSTNLAYTGTVSIKYLFNDKVIENTHHNAGTAQLFWLIAKALSGGNIYADRPTKMDVQSSTDNGETWSSMVNTGGIVTSLAYMTDSNGDWVNKLTATFSRQMLNSDFVLSNKYRLALCSSSNTMYATLEVPSEDLIAVTGSMQAIVDWTLKITNAN